MYLFFDLDDTLLDTARAVRLATCSFAAIYPHIVFSGVDEFCTAWQDLADYYYVKWTQGGLTFQQQRRFRIRHFFGDQLSDEEADRIFDVYLELQTGHWSTFSDVAPALEHLISYPMAVLTNGDPEQQRDKLQKLGLGGCFSMLVTPFEAGSSKPHASIFHYASAQVGVQPADCLYVGDLLDSDARAACRAGWHGIWLDRSDNGQDVPDVPVIHSLMELPGLLTHIEDKGVHHGHSS